MGPWGSTDGGTIFRLQLAEGGSLSDFHTESSMYNMKRVISQGTLIRS